MTTTTESSRVVTDPGYGFGAPLLACAGRHGFMPAVDGSSQAVRAESGAIRVRFTR